MRDILLGGFISSLLLSFIFYVCRIWYIYFRFRVYIYMQTVNGMLKVLLIHHNLSSWYVYIGSFCLLSSSSLSINNNNFNLYCTICIINNYNFFNKKKINNNYFNNKKNKNNNNNNNININNWNLIIISIIKNINKNKIIKKI